MSYIFTGLALIGTFLWGISAQAEEVRVAVAANFTEAAKEIAAAFHKETGDTAKLSFGSTGQLYAQIGQAAPFDVFLAADQERPEKAVAEGLAVPGTRFTYAVGRLALWSPEEGFVTGADTLEDDNFTKIALANPLTAPYGAAAVATLRSLSLYDALKPKLVEGQSIAQAYQFVASQNAELGFVALSQLAENDTGSRWLVPQDLYPPIRQDAVLLTHGAKNEAAHRFLAFLKAKKATEIVERFGYGEVQAAQ